MLSTFPTTSITLAQQYRQMHFKEYANLIAVMLLAEKNNLLLINNLKARPPGTMPKPKIQCMTNNSKDKQGDKGKGQQTRYQGTQRPRFRNQRFMGGRQNENKSNKFPIRRNIWQRDSQKQTTKCFRCGGTGHIKRDYKV